MNLHLNPEFIEIKRKHDARLVHALQDVQSARNEISLLKEKLSEANSTIYKLRNTNSLIAQVQLVELKEMNDVLKNALLEEKAKVEFSERMISDLILALKEAKK